MQQNIKTAWDCCKKRWKLHFFHLTEKNLFALQVIFPSSVFTLERVLAAIYALQPGTCDFCSTCFQDLVCLTTEIFIHSDTLLKISRSAIGRKNDVLADYGSPTLTQAQSVMGMVHQLLHKHSQLWVPDHYLIQREYWPSPLQVLQCFVSSSQCWFLLYKFLTEHYKKCFCCCCWCDSHIKNIDSRDFKKTPFNKMFYNYYLCISICGIRQKTPIAVSCSYIMHRCSPT